MQIPNLNMKNTIQKTPKKLSANEHCDTANSFGYVEGKGLVLLELTYINWRHFVEEKGARNNNLHVVVGTNDSFIEL